MGFSARAMLSKSKRPGRCDGADCDRSRRIASRMLGREGLDGEGVESAMSRLYGNKGRPGYFRPTPESWQVIHFA